MNRYIAFLRGINVGGHKKLKMADLKVMMEDLHFADVKTYIQSGNVVFNAKANDGLSEMISKEIEKQFGWEVPVLVKTSDEIAKILKNCSFEKTKMETSYFMLLATPPKTDLIDALRKISYPNEEFVLTKECVYIYFENGLGNAKLNNNFFEKKLKVAATTRNYRTLLKLVELAG